MLPFMRSKLYWWSVLSLKREVEGSNPSERTMINTLTEAQKVHAKPLFLRGENMYGIAKRTRAPEGALKYFLEKSCKNLIKESYLATLPGSIKKIKSINMIGNGYTITQISNMLRVPETVISNWISQHLKDKSET